MTAPCPTFGFRAALELRPDLGERERDAFPAAWQAFLASRGLYSQRGGGNVFVVLSEGAQAMDADRDATASWLSARTELLSWRLGELTDVKQDG